MEIGEVFINRKSSETFQTTLKCSKSMNSFTFSTGFQWARLEVLLSLFWPPGLMFYTSDLTKRQ